MSAWTTLHLRCALPGKYLSRKVMADLPSESDSILFIYVVFSFAIFSFAIQDDCDSACSRMTRAKNHHTRPSQMSFRPIWLTFPGESSQ
jgi:hypothetical protein